VNLSDAEVIAHNGFSASLAYNETIQTFCIRQEPPIIYVIGSGDNVTTFIRIIGVDPFTLKAVSHLRVGVNYNGRILNQVFSMFATSSQIVYVSYWGSAFAVLRRLDIAFSNPPTCESDREFKSDVWNKTTLVFATLNDTFSVPPSQNFTVFPLIGF
jgi:hypothetical protein